MKAKVGRRYTVYLLSKRTCLVGLFYKKWKVRIHWNCLHVDQPLSFCNTLSLSDPQKKRDCLHKPQKIEKGPLKHSGMGWRCATGHPIWIYVYIYMYYLYVCVYKNICSIYSYQLQPYQHVHFGMVQRHSTFWHVLARNVSSNVAVRSQPPGRNRGTFWHV